MYNNSPLYNDFNKCPNTSFGWPSLLSLFRFHFEMVSHLKDLMDKTKKITTHQVWEATATAMTKCKARATYII